MRGLALSLLLAAAMAGCGGGEGGESGGGGSVEIALADFSIQPASLEVEDAGAVTFSVRNDGDVPHALTVEGESTGTLSAGESGELTVDLPAGTYRLFCPVGNHRSQGMEGTVVVAGGGTGGATTGEEEEPGYGYG